MAGASGGIAGLMGAYLLLFPHAHLTLMLVVLQLKVRAAVWMLLWILLQLHGLFVSTQEGGAGGVAWMAHIAGFAAGALLVLPFRESVISAHPLLSLLHAGKLSCPPGAAAANV